jgi:hypothetical protein
MALPLPIVTKLAVAQQHYLHISYIISHTNWSISMQSMVKSSVAPLDKEWLFTAPNFVKFTLFNTFVWTIVFVFYPNGTKI